MTACHIGTMLRDGATVIALVINNRGYLIEKLLAKRKNAIYNDIPHWCYAQLPAAMGGAPDSFFTATVKTTSELSAAFESALAAHSAGKFSLLELCTAPLDVPRGAQHIVPEKFLDE